MTQKELTLLNLGNSLDDLANLDPRGYGVCKLLYRGAREYTGAPLCLNSAKKLAETIHAGDLVYIMTGFVLLPYKKGEMDGIVSSVLLARALVKAFDAKPVIICPEDNLTAVENLAACVGLHLHKTIADLKACPVSMGMLTFTKKTEEAEACADQILSYGIPSAVIAIECPGANKHGVYHNSAGMDVSDLEAKQDILFEKLRDMGVLNIAIGDLGNEIGMAAIGDYIAKHIPYTGEGGCVCGCGGGSLVRVKADNIITATVSDWGCYAMIAMLSYLLENPDIMHDAKLEVEAMVTASRSGMVDAYGWLIPAIDGFGTEITGSIVTLMKEMVKSTFSFETICKNWFEKVIEQNEFGV